MPGGRFPCRWRWALADRGRRPAPKSELLTFDDLSPVSDDELKVTGMNLPVPTAVDKEEQIDNPFAPKTGPSSSSSSSVARPQPKKKKAKIVV